MSRPLFRFGLLACIAALALGHAVPAAQAQAAAKPRFEVDLYVAPADKVRSTKTPSAKPGKPRGKRVIEPTGEISQLVVLPGTAKETQVYLVVLQHTGTKEDRVRFRIEAEGDNGPATGRMYRATTDKGWWWRGEDITDEITSDAGIIVDLKPNRVNRAWIEVTGGRKFGEDDVAQFRIVGRSLGAQAREIPISDTSDEVLPGATRDQFVVQFGEGNTSGDEFDLSQAQVRHFLGGYNPDIANWDITSDFQILSIQPNNLCFTHSMQGRWTRYQDVGGKPNNLEGQLWIVANIGGQWYAGFFEWLLPPHTCVPMNSTGAPGNTIADQMPLHIHRDPFNTWKPRRGEKVYIFVTSWAWPGRDGDRQRSQLVEVIWPF